MAQPAANSATVPATRFEVIPFRLAVRAARDLILVNPYNQRMALKKTDMERLKGLDR
jgi:hypothetical protein